MEPTTSTKFVDREEEMRILKDTYKEVESGAGGRIVLIKGEAGIGKTRLVHEFSRQLGDGTLFLESACVYAETAEPYLPFIQALEPYMDGGASGGAPQQFSMGGMGIAGVGVSVEEVGVAALGVLSSENTGRDGDVKEKRGRMFENFTRTILSLSSQNPLVFFMDDFQWADAGTAQLLLYIAKNIRNQRIMLVVSYRPEEVEVESSRVVAEVVDDLSILPATTTISLQRLGKEHIAEMVRDLLSRKDVPDEFIDALYKESAGNPFFVEEVVKSLISEGVIDPSSPTWDTVSLSTIRIPRSIKDVVARRIMRLDPETLRVLRYAVVIGDHFSFEMLREVTGLDEEKLVDYIDRLIENKLIHEDTSTEEEVFIFDHIQIITVVYEGMSRSRLRILHKKVGEALERMYRENIGEVVYALAKHFFLGKVPDKAVAYSILAGKKATASYAFDEALRYYSMALNVIDRYPENEEFMAYKGDVYFNMAWVENMLGEWESAVQHYRQAIEINQKLGNRKKVADAYRELGHLYMEKNMWEEADENYQRALEIYEELGDYYGIADTYRGHAKVDWRLGNLDEAIEHLQTVIENALKVGDDNLIGSTYIDMGNVYHNKGDAEKAKEQYRKAIEILVPMQNYPEIARAYNNMGEVYKEHGEYEEAIECYKKSLEYAEKGNDVRTKGYALGNLGETYAKLNDLEKAEKYTADALEIFERLEEKYVIASLYMNYGIIYRKKKEWEKAEEAFKKGIEMMKSLNIQYDLGIIYLEYGEAMLEKGDVEKAREALQKGAEIFEQIGAKSYFERAKKLLGNL